MMGLKAVEPKLYLNFSLDNAVPGNHLARRMAAAVDFDFVRGLVQRRYSHTGQPSLDPVVLFKLWLLGYLFNITSERRLCEEAGLNLAWRWFLGYELDEPIPDHSVLSKARRRFGLKTYEKFFARIVQLCEAAGLVQGDVLFVDSTLTKANAAPQGLRSRSLVQQLRRPREFVSDLWLVNDKPDLDPVATQPLTEEREHRSRRPRGRDARRSAVNEFSLSPVDPDAQTFRKPGRTPILGHKTHFLANGGRATIITAVEARGACEPDGNAVGTLLDKHRAVVSRSARELVGDRGYGSEAALQMCVERDVQPLLGVRASTNPHGGLNRTAFTYVAGRDVYVCPQGKELQRVGENVGRRQTIYKPMRGTCRSCPIRAQCVSSATADRVVTRRWDADLVEAMQARFASHRGRALLRQRQIVSERINADAKEKHGFAKAQFRGRANMQIQALLTAATLNLKKLAGRRPEAHTGMAAMAGHLLASTWSRIHHIADCLAARQLLRSLSPIP